MAYRLASGDQLTPIAFTINQVCLKVPIGRSMIYLAMKSGALASFRIGTRRLISAAALEAWIQGLQDDAK